MSFILHSILIGAGATALFDLWRWALHRLSGRPRPDWALPGRWFAHVARGHVWHDDIAAAAPVRHEAALGWAGHYAIGILYAAALLAIWGMGWAAAPRPGPALTVGVVTIAAGWFFMAPAMGAGIAAARAPHPWTERAAGLAAHVVFGLGLYLSALILRGLAGG